MIFDLRDYTTTPEMRDKLIEKCENVFFPEQIRLGAFFAGHFRDADDPNRFVWLRGIESMEKRKEILTAFYTDGEMWKAAKTEANGWIVDSDNVLLLNPLEEFSTPSSGASEVGMFTYLQGTPLSERESGLKRREVENEIKKSGGRLLQVFATNPAENNYPRHAIRSGDYGHIWFASFQKFQPLKLSNILQRRLLPTASSKMR